MCDVTYKKCNYISIIYLKKNTGKEQVIHTYPSDNLFTEIIVSLLLWKDYYVKVCVCVYIYAFIF
jgi:hypothetical protein